MLEFELLGDTGTLNVELESNTETLGFNLLGGTKDYKRLDNKPKINNVELIDNKTLHELGIQPEGNYIVDEDYTHTDNNYTDNEKTKLASLQNYDDTEVRQLIDTKQPRGNYITQETDPTVPSHVKSITQSNITNWNNKQEQLISGTNIKTINNQNILGNGNINIESGASDYPDLTNKPKINNVELNGNKTSSDLGLQPAGNYALRSEIPDVSNFITNTVDDLVNYYKKTETFTKQEVNNLISAITTMDIRVVQTLPTEDISITTIYLVPKTTAETNDAYDEYIYVSSNWEHIGSTEVDLTNYVTNTDYASNNTGGVIKTNTNYGTNVDSNGSLRGTTKTYADYDSMHSLGLISKVTLENVIEGKGLVSNTDYGSFATGGVIKASSTYGTQFASTGAMYAQTKTYEQYTDSTSPGLFIGKGTLENVIAGKGLVSNTDYATTSQAGLVKASSGAATDVITSNGLLYARNLDYATYSSASDNAFIGKGTLENVIEGKGLVSNTDYTTSSVGGVIKTSASYGTSSTTAGQLCAVEKSFSDYSDSGDKMFISKGTLENVITGKNLATKSDIPKVFYGTSATGATTAAKVVVCEEFTEADLVAGTRITVYFTNANTYNGQATLNINGTGAKNIYYNGTTANARYMWVAGESVEFIYNGTQWATINGGLASTAYYGVTKLATSAGSDSQAYALTPRGLFYFANYSIAPYYSASSTYAVGDKVRYSYYIYECITAIETPEAWTAEHWQQIDTVQEQIDDKEDKSNKVTSISSSSTNTQYPSAKCVYDYIQALNGNGVAY